MSDVLEVTLSTQVCPPSCPLSTQLGPPVDSCSYCVIRRLRWVYGLDLVSSGDGRLAVLHWTEIQWVLRNLYARRDADSTVCLEEEGPCT